jgi:hypothetical protein
MYIPETVLSSPLIEENYEVFLDELRRCESLHSTPPGQKKSHTRIQARTYHDFPGHHLSHRIIRHTAQMTPDMIDVGSSSAYVADCDRNEPTTDLHRGTAAVERYLDHLAQGMTSVTEGDDTLAKAIRERRPVVTPQLVTAYKNAMFWQGVVEVGVQCGREGTPWVEWNRSHISSGAVIVPSLRGDNALLTHNVVLMLKDLCMSRFVIKVAACCHTSLEYMDPLLDAYSGWANRVLKKFGNYGYELLKCVEPLCKVWIIRNSEKMLDGRAQFEKMVKKINSKEYDFLAKRGVIPSSGHRTVAERYVAILDALRTPGRVAETIGFLKLSGHPYADPRGGCVSAKTLAQAHIQMKDSDCLKLEWSFCHLYCKGYLRNHKRWPAMEFDRPGGKMTRLEELHITGQPSLPMGLTLYPPEDWMHARFIPSQKFDTGEDILSLISDKSLSHLRTEFDAPWFGSLPYCPPKPTTKRRVVEELLATEELNLEEWCGVVSRRAVPEEHKIVTVCPKEREMKLEPRMFAMMTLQMRSFFVLLEHNIAIGIFKEIPEQTMTMSRSELVSQFLEFTKPVGEGGWARLFVEIDFSRWNLNWRDQVVGPIGHRMDQIYGTIGLFTYTHEFFSSSMIILRMGEHPPDGLTVDNRHDPPESDTLWYNHDGGFEGIAQKLWTACTVAAIHTALWPLGLIYRIMGQADNQVCVIDVPLHTVPHADRPDHMQTLSDTVTTEISRVCRLVGQEVKAEECIESTCLMTYGKEMWLNGAYLSTIVKYLSRVFPTTTPDSPSLHEYWSGISSGGVAACDRGDDTLTALTITKLVEAIFLHRELSFSLLHSTDLRSTVDHTGLTKHKDTLVLLMMIVPSNLGGGPTSTPLEYLYRGHPDPLASSCSSLSLFKTLNEVTAYAHILELPHFYQTTPDLSGLILDPYSAPLTLPGISSTAVARQVREILPLITSNRHIKPLCAGGEQGIRDETFNYILQFTPCHPKVWHDLYKSSPAGVADAFSRRFTSGATLKTISRTSGSDIGRTSLEVDLTWAKAVIIRLSSVFKITQPHTPNFVTLPDQMRARWPVPELVGVGSVHPLSRGHMHIVPSAALPKLPHGCNEMGLVVALSYSPDSAVCSTTRGVMNPYLGSSTSDKAVARWVKPVDSSPPTRDIIKILTIRDTMTAPGSTAYTSLTHLAQSRSMVDISWFEASTKLKTGGTDGHRYSMERDDRGSFVASSPNWPSHMVISTNNSHLAGRVDYRVSFQQWLTCMLGLTAWAFRETHTSPPFGVLACFILDDRDLVEDQLIGINGPPLGIPEVAGDSYYLRVEKLTFTQTGFSMLTQPLSLHGLVVEPMPITAAVEELIWDELSRPCRMTRHRSRTWATPNSSVFLDLSEVERLTPDVVARALVLAIYRSACWRIIPACTVHLPAKHLMRSTAESYSRRTVPRLLGILRHLPGGGAWAHLHPGPGTVDERAVLATWVGNVSNVAAEGIDPGLIYLHTAGTPSFSSQLASGVMLLVFCGLFNLTITPRSAKIVRSVVLRCLETPEEASRVYRLMWLARGLKLISRFRVTHTAPAIVSRQLRVDPIPVPPQLLVDLQFRTQPVVPRDRNGVVSLTGRPLLLSDPHAFSPEELLATWGMRPQLQRGSARARWGPLFDLVPATARVLVLGIGIGGVTECLPATCVVIGVDLGSHLGKLGHDMITYHPPLTSQHFMLHTCSWVAGGDVYSSAVQETLCREIGNGVYDAVIIDIETGSPTERLKLRHTLAQSAGTLRVPVYVRVLVDAWEMPILVDSWRAVASLDDHCWIPEVGLDREVVIGGGRSPLGLFAPAVPRGARLDYPALPPPVIVRGDAREASFQLTARIGAEISDITRDACQPPRYYRLPPGICIGSALLQSMEADPQVYVTTYGRMLTHDLYSLCCLALTYHPEW